MYKIKTAKTKAKELMKPEDILREGSLQQVRQMYEEADKKSKVIHFQYKHTALHYAAMNSDSAVLLYLLTERRLNPNAVDTFAEVPLDLAIQAGYVNNIKTLIEYGADFERKNSKGLSVIYALRGYGHNKKVDIVKEIIETAKKRKQQAEALQLIDPGPVVLSRRNSHSSSKSDSVTEDEISSSASSSSPSSSLVSTFFEKIGGWLSSSPVSSPEKESLLPSPSKKFKHD